MKSKFIALFCLFSCLSISAYAKETICEGQYALCAYAKCMPIPGEKGKVICTCEVKSGYSIGTTACEAKPKAIMEGYETLISRYYPVEKYVSCKNKRPWANCYNSACIINKDDPSKAFCTCSIVQNKGDYMYASDSCDAKGCEEGIISSYLIKDGNKDLAKLKKVKNYDKLPGVVPKVCK